MYELSNLCNFLLGNVSLRKKVQLFVVRYVAREQALLSVGMIELLDHSTLNQMFMAP